MAQYGRKYHTVLWILALVGLLGLIAVFLATRGLGGERGYLGSHPLRISELMARNTSVPNADGVICDWIEIENTSSGAFNLSGYKLSDQVTGAKYAFPSGTVIPAGGYLVVWCTEEYTGGLYAPFGLSKDGGEIVELMNASNVILDQVTTLPTRKNTVMVRAADGGLTLSAAPTPGFPNTEEGYRAYLAACGEVDGDIRLSEIMTANTLYPNADGLCCDWVELVNLGTETRDIGGYMLTDRLGSYRFAFPSGTLLEGGGRIVVWCTEEAQGPLYAPFALSRSGGETVTLTNAASVVLDQIETPALKSNQVCALVEGEWTILPYATPGYDNTEAGLAAWQTAQGYDDVKVAVSEAVANNRAYIADENGAFPDYIELYNDGTETVDLSRWWLSDDPEKPDGWQLPEDTVLPAGGCLLIFADGGDQIQGELHASFSLSRGEAACLSTPTGQLVSVFALSGEEDAWVSPGWPNTAEGYEAYQRSLTAASPLVISEVATSNSKYYYQYDAGYSDWVEVRNVSSQAVELSDYYLTDDKDEPFKWRLPSRSLPAGETAVYLCSGDESLSQIGYTHTNFSLNARADTLYLHTAEGVRDYVWLHDIPVDGTCGRMEGQGGFFYFTAPTPGKANEGGIRGIAPTPSALTADGVFNDVQSVTVELAGEGPLYYTTDGSVPTAESALYTGPITLTGTTVLRASCIQPGLLPSPPLTLSYIINEHHTLPVVSLVAEPRSLFYSGIYDVWWAGTEVPASVALYEEDGSFTIDCGIKMYGHTALTLPKRSFKLCFRPRYGTEALHYDVFDSDISAYSSLVLRSGQDYPFSIFRDELFGDLCAEFTDNVLVQDNKFCILYLNGEYWGIYFLKEAYSEEYYAAHRNVDPKSVTKVQAPAALDSEFYEVIRFAQRHDMSKEENYRTFCDMVDIDSLIDWCIIEGYSANADVQQNLRYFRSTQDGNRWSLAFYDLDWAFYYENNLTMVFYGVGEDGNSLQHCHYTAALLQNKEFRDRFCARLGEALSGPLSTGHVLAKIDELHDRLAPEVARERERWPNGNSWESWVQQLRDFVNNGWTEKIIQGAVNYCHLSAEERESYFGGAS